jgi:tRNA(fMet)-specific endonuclease VapC
MIYFLDTNICIYFLKGTFPKLKENLLSHSRNEIFIPSIVKAELFYGAEKSIKKTETINKLKLFLEPFTIVGFGDKESLVYAHIRANLEKQGSPIGPNDLIIASTVIANNGILVTKNIKEFLRVNGLRIEDWTVG